MSSSATVNPVIEYHQQIESGKIIVSQKVRRVYQKLVADINNGDGRWIYDEYKAQRPIDFIQRFCKHSKGKQARKPISLELWEKAFIAAAFGFVDRDTEQRRFQEVALMVARKNGKSLLASAIGLYLLIADGEAGPEIYSVATKKDQAKIIWLEARNMVRQSPLLNKKCKCRVADIVTDFNFGVFKPLSSDSNTLDGLNVHGGLIDELHAIEDGNIYDVINDGKSAREQPMIVITTTAGTVREGIFDNKYDEYSRTIQGYDDGSYISERVLPIIYELDSRSEWLDPACWSKANPGLGTIKNMDILAAKVSRAKASPIYLKNLLTKDFNVRETVGEAWLTFDQIDNTAKFDIKELKPRYGIGGVDLSATTDLTAACCLFMVPNDNHVYVKSMYWIPEDLIESRERDDRIPYTQWAKMGLVRLCPGNKVNYHMIVEWFRELQYEDDIYLFRVGYDRWSAQYWVDEMKESFGEIVMVPVAQGAKTLSAPMKLMGADLTSKILVYDNNPITKWCLSNVSVITDRNLNIQPCKTHNQRRRIDGAAALLDAYAVLEQCREEYLSNV